MYGIISKLYNIVTYCGIVVSAWSSLGIWNACGNARNI